MGRISGKIWNLAREGLGHELGGTYSTFYLGGTDKGGLKREGSVSGVSFSGLRGIRTGLQQISGKSH